MYRKGKGGEKQITCLFLLACDSLFHNRRIFKWSRALIENKQDVKIITSAWNHERVEYFQISKLMS